MQSRNSSHGHVAILWDIENCPVPSDVRPEYVAGNIRMALRVHPVINGAVTLFSAYGDFNAFPRLLRQGCQMTGVKLVDVPNGRKDAADKAIFVDLFLFALDNPPPASIVLISGDVDFAPALHVLGQRGYTIILVIPSGVGVSSALSSAGQVVWDWPSVARGEVFVPPTYSLIPHRGSHANDIPDCRNDEEAIIYWGVSQRNYSGRDFSMISEYLTEYNSTSISAPCFPTTMRSHSLPSDLTEGSSDVIWVQPRKLNGLKRQLVKLLELCGGCLPLSRVPPEYLKVFGRPLYVKEYGASKLVNLFKKMADTMAIEGNGPTMLVSLQNSSARPSAPPLVLAKKDKKGKGTREENKKDKKGKGTREEKKDKKRKGTWEENTGNVTWNGSSDKISDDVRVVPSRLNEGSSDMKWVQPGNLNGLIGQLVNLLELYGGCLPLSCVPSEYLKVFGKPLYVKEYGASKLVNLFKKMADTMSIEGIGPTMFVSLQNTSTGPSAPPLVLAKKDKKGKGTREENTGNITWNGSSDELSDDVRVVNEGSSDMMWVQPGDLNGLKGQLVKLLELSGGCLPLSRVPSEYLKVFGSPLNVSEYGASKLVNLFKKMADTMAIEGNGPTMFVSLQNSSAGPNAPPVVLAKKDKKGKGTREENTGNITWNGSSDELSDDVRVVNEGSSDMMWVQPGDLNGLKEQLVNLLELSGGCLPLSRVPSEYLKVFGSPLNVKEYGASKLVNLFKKMADMMAIEGNGPTMFVSLQNSSAGPSAPPLVLAKKDKKGKGTQEESKKDKKGKVTWEENSGNVTWIGSSDELSDDVKVIPFGLNEGSSDMMWVQLGDLNDLKGQLVMLLELSGGCLPLSRVAPEYVKVFGRPLKVKEYGASKLVNLFKKMADTMAIEGNGPTMFVYLQNSSASPSASPLVLAKKDEKGKGTQEENTGNVTWNGSSDELSDDVRVVLSGLNEGSSDMMWVRSGDLNGLKGQPVKLLELSGGCLPLSRIPPEYPKVFGRPLYVKAYGASKLVNLFKKMADTMAIEGDGPNMFVYLQNLRAGPSAPLLVLAKKEKEGKGTQEENTSNITWNGSSNELSDDLRVVAEEDDGKADLSVNARGGISDRSLEQFGHTLQEILMSYSCRIFLGCFEEIYKQRYRKPLDCNVFVVNQLEQLLEKVRHVVTLHEDLRVKVCLLLPCLLFLIFYVLSFIKR